MSQKGEKYARRMERRVDKLEQDVAAITTEQTTQGVRISAVEDDLAVYRAAVSARELKQAAAEIKAAKERRTARAAERERKARRRNKVLAFIALALFVAVCVVMVAKAYSEISIHAPREGGDFHGVVLLLCLAISIHAPREGGDPRARRQWSCCR